MKKLVVLLLLMFSSLCFEEFESDALKIKLEKLKGTEEYNLGTFEEMKKEYVKEIIGAIKCAEYYDEENKQRAVENFIKADKEWDKYFAQQSKLLDTVVSYRAGRIYWDMYSDFRKEMYIKRLEELAKLYDIMNQG